MAKDFNKVPPRALVIDDDDMSAMLLFEALKKEGFEVRKAQNGQEAFSLVIKERYDIITTDLEMPKMNGVNFLKRLRNSPYKNTKVIVVSGHLDKDKLQDLIKLKVNKIFAKPFKIGEIITTINTLVEYNGEWKDKTYSELTEDEFEVG